MGGAGRTIAQRPLGPGEGRSASERLRPGHPASPGRRGVTRLTPPVHAPSLTVFSFLCRTSEGRVACSKPGPGFGRAARVVRAGGLRVAKGRRPRGRLPLFTSLSVPRWPHPASFGVCSFSLSLDIF